MTWIDVTKTPFSKYGSYISVCATEGAAALEVHNALRLFRDHIYNLTFRRGDTPVVGTLQATPWCITLRDGDAEALIYLRDDNGLVIDSRGLDFTLELATSFGFGGAQTDRRFRTLASSVGLYCGMDVPVGQAHLYGPMEERPGPIVRSRDCILHVQCEDGRAQCVLVIDPCEPDPRRPMIAPDPEREVAAIRAEWEAFRQAAPPVPAGREEPADTAWYNMWACFVRKGGNYAYDAVIMAKKFMCAVWAWDHCFNALALTPLHPQAGLEQFLLPFAYQKPSGAIPDCFGRDGDLPFGGTKPPIHGWTFSKMMDAHTWDAATLRRVYDHLVGWTEWWFTYRDLDGNGLPDYPIALDSGWDNSSLLEHAFHLESPDLAAFLVLQMHALARIARELGDTAAAEGWVARAQGLLDLMLQVLWTGEYFTARRSHGDLIAQPPTSSLSVMPIALGDLLPREIFDRLVQDLETRYLTAHGPATEAPSSPLYDADGYWTGPIWAPSTSLLVDGLRRGGREALAEDIMRRFCDMIQFHAGGNFENFDALTGKGLRAPGYSWTAAVNLLFMMEMAGTYQAK